MRFVIILGRCCVLWWIRNDVFVVVFFNILVTLCSSLLLFTSHKLTKCTQCGSDLFTDHLQCLKKTVNTTFQT